MPSGVWIKWNKIHSHPPAFPALSVHSMLAGFILLLFTGIGKKGDWHATLQLTPLDRSFFVMGGEGLAYGLMTGMVIVVWFAAYVLLSWLLIRKEELK
jgi:hypothetical protein